MNEMKRDMIRIQELVGSAFGQTGALVALSDGGHMNPKKLQKTLEQTMEHFESAALELRRLCEQYSPGTGGFSKKSVLPAMDVTGSVEEFGYAIHATPPCQTIITEPSEHFASGMVKYGFTFRCNQLRLRE